MKLVRLAAGNIRVCDRFYNLGLFFWMGNALLCIKPHVSVLVDRLCLSKPGCYKMYENNLYSSDVVAMLSIPAKCHA